MKVSKDKEVSEKIKQNLSQIVNPKEEVLKKQKEELKTPIFINHIKQKSLPVKSCKSQDGQLRYAYNHINSSKTLHANGIKSTIAKSINISSNSIILRTERSKKLDISFNRRKLKSRTSMEKFPDIKVLESISQRHSMRLYESKIFGKDNVLSSQIEKQISNSLLKEKESDDKSILNSFIIKKESIGGKDKPRLEDKAIPNGTISGDQPNTKQDSLNNDSVGNGNIEMISNISPHLSNKKVIQESKIDESGEINIKISILNMNNNIIKSTEKLKTIEDEVSNTTEDRIIDMTRNQNKPHDHHKLEFTDYNLIEDYLIQELLHDQIYVDLVNHYKSNSPKKTRRIPKLDIGSLEEKEILKIKESVDIETLENLNNNTSKSNNEDQFQKIEEQEMLSMMKEKENMNQLVNPKEKDDVEEIIYAIRTNIETIVEYSDLLIKIITEDFMHEVLKKINTFNQHKHKIEVLMQHEFKNGGWKRGLLEKMDMDCSYINQIMLNLISESGSNQIHSEFLGDQTSKENCIKGNLNHDTSGLCVQSDKRSTKAQETSNYSKMQLKTISNIDNFATIRSFSDVKLGDKITDKASPSQINRFKFKHIWDYPSKPYLILEKKVFLKLTDKILSSYAEANIQENLFDIQKIFHRSIFDAFNESLSEYIFRTKKYNIFMEEILILKKKQFDFDDLSFFLAKAKYILIEKASEMVGFLLNKEDSELGK